MRKHAKYVTYFLTIIAFLFLPAMYVVSQEYESMQGVESVKAAYDFRVGDAEVALGHLDLIHSMMNDQSMIVDGNRPEIVVVFIGSSVNLISNDQMGVAAGPQEEIARKISAMEEDGVRFEICMTSAHALEVAPDSILPEVEQVGNGWISLIGYQHNGYAMIADF